MENLKIASYNVHNWYSDEGRYNLQKIVELYRELKPDIICLQEVTGFGLTKFQEMTGLKNRLKFGSVAILSNLEIKDWAVESGQKEKVSGGRHLRFITAEVKLDDQTFYVNGLHLDHRVEPNRMNEMKTIEKRLEPLLQAGAPQVWLGDFNSLSEGDYSEEEWKEVARVRSQNSWEQPKTQVTKRMTELGFSDSWALCGRPEPISTCRFGTHIDYIYTNPAFRDMYSLDSILHHPSQASDHQLVMATFQKKQHE